MSELLNILRSARSALFERWTLRPLHTKVHAIRAWYSTPLGAACLDHEQQKLQKFLKSHRGQHILQLSPLSSLIPDGLESFRCVSRLDQQAVGVEPEPGEGRCVGEYEKLPFDDESFEFVVVHHVLEFSQNPQAVLKEAGRVTANGGYIAVIAFNPFSLTGVVSMIGSLLRPEGSIWARKKLMFSRVSDWLKFLDFGAQASCTVFHDIPVNHRRFVSFMRPLFQFLARIHMPLGGVYCVLARKDTLGTTMLGPVWRSFRMPPALIGAKPASATHVANQED